MILPLLFAISAVIGEQTLNELYPTNINKLSNGKLGATSKEQIDQNVKWISSVLDNAKTEQFVTSIINLEGTLPLNPINAYHLIDNSLFCWAILTYDSTFDQYYDGKLGNWGDYSFTLKFVSTNILKNFSRIFSVLKNFSVKKYGSRKLRHTRY